MRETARLRGFFDFFGVFFQRAVGIELTAEDLAVADDDAEKIVEVVGDSAGETADGFHLGGHAELLFESAALGDIFGEDFKTEAA